MRKTKNFDIKIPELGDVPDITQVSNAIQDLEDALAGTLEIMDASIQGSELTLKSVSRQTKRTKYYDGMSIRFLCPQTISANTLKTVVVDDLPQQVISINFDIVAGEYVDITYHDTSFTAHPVMIQKNERIDSNSNETVATSRAVKKVNDKVNTVSNEVSTLDKNKVSKNGDTINGDLNINNIGKSTLLNINSNNIIMGHLAYSTSDKNIEVWNKSAQNSLKLYDNGDTSLTANNLKTNTKEVISAINELKNKLDSLNICPYNVGDVYITTKNGDPSAIWSGTSWKRIEGRFLLATSGGGATQQTGGSSSVTLSVNNMPSHNHSAWQSSHSHTQPSHVHGINTFVFDGSSRSTVTDWDAGIRYKNPGNTHSAGGENTGSAQPSVSVGNTGGGKAFSIMPPYFTVHVWVRIK